MSYDFLNCDCMDKDKGMPSYPDKSIDLIITSPPFNLGDKHHTGNNSFSPYPDNMPEDKYQDWQILVLNECHRLLKDNGCMFYNHKNRIRNGLQITPYQWILRSKLKVKQEIVWFNGSQNFDKCRFYPMTERVYWLSKTDETLFTNNINHHDLFEWDAEGTDKEHKRAYPLKLVKDILSCFPKGLKVVDPFCGSGTSIIACIDLGFDVTGFELDADYYKAATKRINDFKSQLKIF